MIERLNLGDLRIKFPSTMQCLSPISERGVIDDRNDAADVTLLSEQTFHDVEDLLGQQGYVSSIIPIIYHASFGDRTEALHRARKFYTQIAEIESLYHRLSAYLNVGLAIELLGAHDEARDIY